MKRFGSAMVTVVAIAMLTVVPTAQKKAGADALFEAARQKESVEGDLAGAIKQYQAIIAAHKGDRGVTATALVRMAQCYQKLGDSESRRLYEQIVRDYADQKEAVAIAQARLGGESVAKNGGITTRQVWAGPTVDVSGAISPDGRSITYTDWSTGNLAVHDLASGRDRSLTNKNWNDSPEYAFGSVFSPDGRQLVYGWTTSTSPFLAAPELFFELRLIELNGGTPRPLFAQRDVRWIELHDWSPDGKWLAAVVSRADRSAQLGLISSADGTLRVLKSFDWRGASKLAFSPDSRYLAYDVPINDESEQRDIYVMAVDGNRETPATVHPANDRVLGWSPDGTRLLFASDRSGSNGVWALTIADGRPQGVPELIKADINPRAMAITRSGALYYSVVASGRDIYTASVDLESGKLLSTPAIIETPHVGFKEMPAWSPDGKYLAYLSRRDPHSNSERLNALEILSTETGKVRELRPTVFSLLSRRPVWSQDGSYLLVSGNDNKGRPGIYRVDMQSGASTPVVTGEPGRISVARGLSPDGKTLFIGRADSNGAVVLAQDMESGTQREIVRRHQLGDSSVSPDGRYLAVTAFDNKGENPGALLVVPVGGGQARELLRVSPPDTLGVFVTWLPDGKSLLFRKGQGAARDTFRISAEGGAPDKYGAEWTAGPPSIRSDGRQVAFMTGQIKFEIWALENFLPKSVAATR